MSWSGRTCKSWGIALANPCVSTFAKSRRIALTKSCTTTSRRYECDGGIAKNSRF